MALPTTGSLPSAYGSSTLSESLIINCPYRVQPKRQWALGQHGKGAYFHVKQITLPACPFEENQIPNLGVPCPLNYGLNFYSHLLLIAPQSSLCLFQPTESYKVGSKDEQQING